MDTNASIAQNAESRTQDSGSIQQNDRKQNKNVVIEKASKTSEELRFSPSALSDLLNAFLLDATVSESQIDKALVLLRLSPTTLVDFDESSIVAVLLNAIGKSDEHTASKYLLLLSSLLSFTVSPRSLRFIIDYIVSPGRTWRPYSYELVHQLKLASSFPNNILLLYLLSQSFPIKMDGHFNHGFILILHCASSVKLSHDIFSGLPDIYFYWLFSFQTDKGLGYTGHFLGTLFIVTSIRAKEKGLQHCVPTEFQPCRWYMLTLVFVYNRWTKSELRFYVDGKIISSVDMAWPISTSDSFDRCVIGGSFDQREDNLFSGRIASITGFTEALLPQQISGLYSLGPNYNGQLKFESGVRGILNETERKALIESKLSASIMFSYYPSACDHNLCLDQSPKPNSVFTHAPHALMQGKVKAVRTTSLQSALQSLGGIQLLYLLLEQLDYNFEDVIESGATMEPFPVS
ncbi:unnamed protein product [Rodentolepis nana]|uniref:DUF4704 domain-containing protein n=1 Tax=Rodentolepis nana TaxID=102285 RepID=A0A0R3TWL1_RODNA|nr:unnamed protein product [Rodentolepis nana]